MGCLLILLSGVSYASADTGGDCDIMWDLTHGVYLNYEPAGDYSVLTGMLEGKGYTVDTTDIGLNNVDLSDYEVLVLSIGSSYFSPYTPDEISTIKTFVANGGGLLIMGENTGCPNDNLNPVSQEFGTTLGISYLSPIDLYITDMTTHPVFNGVSMFYYRAAGELAGAGALSGPAIAWTDDGEIVMTAVSSPGKVIVTGDCNFCDNDYIAEADNLALSENIFDWLCCSSPIPTPEYPTLMIPGALILGMLFITGFMRINKKED